MGQPTLKHGLLCSLFVLLGLAGCGLLGGGSDGGSDSVELDAFVRQTLDTIARGSCTATYECPRKNHTSIAYVSRFGDKQTCTDKLLSTLGDQNIEASISDIQKDIDEGLSTYDSKKAKECLDTLDKFIDDSPCKANVLLTRFQNFSACRSALKGTHEEGEACNESGHCKTLNCNQDATGPDTCYGNCGPAAQKVGGGQPCGSSTTNYCNLDANLLCSFGGTEQSVCKKTGSISEGISCSRSLFCANDLSCLSESCESLTLKGEGESCAPQDASVRCKPGLVCYVESIGGASVDATCTPPKSAGDPCYRTRTCKFGLYCDGADLTGATQGTCTQKKANGEPCTNSEECKSSLCQNDTCTGSSQEDEEMCTLPDENGS